MKITFLGTGLSQAIELDSRTRSSVAVDHEGTTFVIDCSPDFLKQVTRENIDKIDFMVLTHAHNDAIGGIPQLVQWLKEKDIDSFPIFAEKETIIKIQSEYKQLNKLALNVINSYEPFGFKGLDFDITPFKIMPSTIELSALGYRFNDVVYSEDLAAIPDKSSAYYQNAEMIISDAAMYFGHQSEGHNVDNALNLAKKYNPNKFVLTQAGHTYPAQDIANKEIQTAWDKVKGDSKTEVVLSEDGMAILTKHNFTLNLSESKEGLYLVDPHSKMVWDRSKRLIVKSKYYRTEIGKLLYLLGDGLCYGLIKLHNPDKMNLVEFEESSYLHKVTNEERKKWWPHKEILYGYKFDLVTMYKVPRPVKVHQGMQSFIKDFDFISVNEMIHDVDSYDASKLSDELLREDWRIVCAWYSTKIDGGVFKYSIEQIVLLAKNIYDELIKRGTAFHPDYMTPNSLKLYNIVSKNESKEMSEVDMNDMTLINDFEDAVLIKNCICVMGSYIARREGHTPNDMDILIRMDEPSEYIKRAIEVRLSKMVPFAGKLHFVWGDLEGPQDSHLPLYDLKLTRIKPTKIVKMSEEQLNILTKPEAMKPKDKFYQVDEAVEFIFTVGGKFAIEKKYNGFRGLIVKQGEEIKIYNEQSKRVDSAFPHIVAQAKELSNNDYVLDTEIVGYEGTTPLDRAEMAKFIHAGEHNKQMDDSQIIAHAFDCMYLKEDITSNPWYERKSILHSLHFTKNIKEVASVVIDTKPEAKHAINMVKGLPGSEGAMIKNYSSKYYPGTENSAWIKYRTELAEGNTTTGSPGIIDIQGKIVSDKIVHVKFAVNPMDMPNLDLIHSWNGLEQIYTDFLAGKDTTYSHEDIINLGRVVYLEVEERVKDHKMVDIFKTITSEFYKIVSKEETDIENIPSSNITFDKVEP